MTCEDMIDDIIDLSKEPEPFKVEILKIYVPDHISKSLFLLECEGKVSTSPGNGLKEVKFRLKKDADGELFVGYEMDPS